MRFYLVQAVLRSQYGISRMKHRIVVAPDAIGAARECFTDLPASSKVPGKKFPEHFKVWAQSTPESFRDDVGTLVVDDEFDEDTNTPLDAIMDMFESKPVEVRL